MITGKDQVSLEILEHFEQNVKVKDIPSLYKVSLDQAKRLSRYHSLLKQSNEYLDDISVEKIKLLGLKSLSLAPLFKAKDWDELNEILESVSNDTKRTELPILMKALKEKRERIRSYQIQVNSKLRQLEKKEEEILKLENENEVLMRRLEKEVSFLNKYPKKVRRFLFDHLGVHKDEYKENDYHLVLAKRLDSNWQSSLKKKKIIEYNRYEYVWMINDLDLLVEDYLRRTNKKIPYNTEWDYEKEINRKRNEGYGVPSDPYYKSPTGLGKDLTSSFEKVEAEKARFASEREKIKKDIKQLKKTSPKSFMEAVEARNQLSEINLKTHALLQDKALKWLYNQGYIAASEVTMPNGKKVDVIGYNEYNNIIIIEIKVTKSDLENDYKWTGYLPYCNQFYFFTASEISYVLFKNRKYKDVGILKEKANTLEIYRDCHLITDNRIEVAEIKYLINRLLAKKYIYGY